MQKKYAKKKYAKNSWKFSEVHKKVLELMKFIKGTKLTPIVHRTVNFVHNMATMACVFPRSKVKIATRIHGNSNEDSIPCRIFQLVASF